MCANFEVVCNTMAIPWVHAIGMDACLFLIVATASPWASTMKLRWWEGAMCVGSPVKMCGTATTMSAIALWWPANSACSP